MFLDPPKVVCLDTSAWGNLARDVATNTHARRAIELLQDGRIIPFLTWHHMTELMNHGNDEVVASRLRLLRLLKFVAFHRQPEVQGLIGSIVEVRDAEIAALLENSELTHSELIQRVRPIITNGFTSGEDFCRASEEWWMYYRDHFSQDEQRRQAETAALTHFPSTDMDQVVSDEPGKYEARSAEDAAWHFSQLAENLAIRLKQDVKKPLPNPDALAFELMRGSYELGKELYGSGKLCIDELLNQCGVDRKRLPAKMTVDDIEDEVVFISELSGHERRLGLPSGSLRHAVRKEMLPSWLVWRDMDRAIHGLPKAETGNVNDKMILGFGLYVDHIQLDKRIRHYVTQLSPKSELFSLINSRLLAGGDHASLVRELEIISR